MADVENDEKRDAGREVAAEDTAIAALMSTYEGRWWMWNFLAFCAPDHARYRFDGDITGAMVRDGRASAGLHIKAQIDRAAPTMYLRMLSDHQTRLKRAADREKTKTQDDAPDVPETLTALERMADAQVAQAKANEPK